MITSAELLEALPIIVSLIVIEGLLSVDNALAIAAMANHLPGRQKLLALRLGILGAYAFRGVVLLMVGWIAQNLWLNLFGAAYLIYLMCSPLTQAEHEDEAQSRRKKPGLLMTVLQIEIMDLSLSIDNVVAAVALAPLAPDGSKKMWVVYAGVFIGILALRLLAGYCIGLLQRFPILAKTAFILVGYVGFILLAEVAYHFHVHAWQKFIGIVIITALTILYARGGLVYTLFRPLVMAAQPVMRAFAGTLDAFFWPLRKLHEMMSRIFRRAQQETPQQARDTEPGA